MARRIIYVAISLGILIMAFMFSSFLIKSKPEPPKDQSKETILQVKAEKVKYTDQTIHFNRRGRVYSYEELPLSSQVAGKIEAGNVALKPGVTFAKGDLLFQIYDEDFKAALRSQRSSLVQVLAAILPDLKIDYPDEYDAWQTFFTTIEIDKPLPHLPEINSESLRVFLSSKGALTSYYTIQQSEITLKKYKVYAPFNGTFQTVQLLPGSIINPGSVVATLLRTDIQEIVIPIEPEIVGWLSYGDQVKVTTADEKIAKGTIDRISQFVDAGTQTLNIYISVKYPETRNILTGSYVNVDFKAPKTTRGMLLPREALVNNNKAYVIEQNKLNMRSINVVSEMEDQVLINGLQENAIIITESIVDAKIGDKVQAINNTKA